MKCSVSAVFEQGSTEHVTFNKGHTVAVIIIKTWNLEC